MQFSSALYPLLREIVPPDGEAKGFVHALIKVELRQMIRVAR
jgi:hypothetical protein